MTARKKIENPMNRKPGMLLKCARSVCCLFGIIFAIVVSFYKKIWTTLSSPMFVKTTRLMGFAGIVAFISFVVGIKYEANQPKDKPDVAPVRIVERIICPDPDPVKSEIDEVIELEKVVDPVKIDTKAKNPPRQIKYKKKKKKKKSVKVKSKQSVFCPFASSGQACGPSL